MPLKINFDDAGDEPGWTALNDEVMGGISTGNAVVAGGRLRFAGALSLANNGGFASVRTKGRDFDLSGAGAVTMRVRGDGRRYQLRLATDARHRGIAVSFGAEFATQAGEWIEVRLPLGSLKATVRGSPVTEVKLNPSGVREIGLLIADKREGPFLLAVDWIAAG